MAALSSSVAASLPSLIANANASVAHSASIDATLPSMAANANVTVITRYASAAVDLPALTANANVVAGRNASIDATLPALLATINVVSGEVLFDLQPPPWHIKFTDDPNAQRIWGAWFNQLYDVVRKIGNTYTS